MICDLQSLTNWLNPCVRQGTRTKMLSVVKKQPVQEEDDIEQLRREVNLIKTDVRSLYQNQQVVQRELVQVKYDHQFLSARVDQKVQDLSKYVDSQIQSVRQRQHCVPTEFYLIVIIIIILFFLLG